MPNIAINSYLHCRLSKGQPMLSKSCRMNLNPPASGRLKMRCQHLPTCALQQGSHKVLAHIQSRLSQIFLRVCSCFLQKILSLEEPSPVFVPFTMTLVASSPRVVKTGMNLVALISYRMKLLVPVIMATSSQSGAVHTWDFTGTVSSRPENEWMSGLTDRKMARPAG